MRLDALPVSWVDLLTGAVLFVGVLMGRKRGLSEELLDTIQWVAIVMVGGLYYREVAQTLSLGSMVGPSVANVAGYILVAITLKITFALLKRGIGEKIVGSDLFGRFEYYLGMTGGMLRFACIYFFLLNLLHAPFYSEQMLSEDEKNQQKNFGDIRFPTLGSIQKAFFKESATGCFAERELASILVQPTEGTLAALRTEDSLGRKRERAIDDLMKRR